MSPHNTTEQIPSMISATESESGSSPSLTSYWDAPIESSLIGKSVSTVDVTLLESNDPDRQRSKKDNYWEEPTESSLIGKSASKINIDTLDHSNGSHNGGGGYWDDAPLCQSLQGKTVSELSLTGMNKQRPDETKKDKKCNYFDWKVKEVKKSLSKLSLTNLLTGSTKRINSSNSICSNSTNGNTTDDDLDRTRGKAHRSQHQQKKSFDDELNNSTGSNGSGGPLTNSRHKSRESWKKSFNRFSANSLKGLDESSERNAGLNRSRGKSNNKKSSVLPLDSSTGSQFSVGGDAVMF